MILGVSGPSIRPPGPFVQLATRSSLPLNTAEKPLHCGLVAAGSLRSTGSLRPPLRAGAPLLEYRLHPPERTP